MKDECSFCFSLANFCVGSAINRRSKAHAKPTLSHENRIIKPRPQAVLAARKSPRTASNMIGLATLDPARQAGLEGCGKTSRMSSPRHIADGRHFRMPGMKGSGV
jgi:hypothetical protein